MTRIIRLSFNHVFGIMPDFDLTYQTHTQLEIVGDWDQVVDEVVINGVRYLPATDTPAATSDPAPTAEAS